MAISDQDLFIPFLVAKDAPKKVRNKVLAFSLMGAYKQPGFSQIFTPMESVKKAEEEEKRKSAEATLGVKNRQLLDINTQLESGILAQPDGPNRFILEYNKITQRTLPLPVPPAPIPSPGDELETCKELIGEIKDLVSDYESSGTKADFLNDFNALIKGSELI